MTPQQGEELARLAKAKGYVLAAHNGRVQFQVGHYGAEGLRLVDIRVTGWVGYDEAVRLMCES